MERKILTCIEQTNFLPTLSCFACFRKTNINSNKKKSTLKKHPTSPFQENFSNLGVSCLETEKSFFFYMNGSERALRAEILHRSEQSQVEKEKETFLKGERVMGESWGKGGSGGGL